MVKQICFTLQISCELRRVGFPSTAAEIVHHQALKVIAQGSKMTAGLLELEDLSNIVLIVAISISFLDEEMLLQM